MALSISTCVCRGSTVCRGQRMGVVVLSLWRLFCFVQTIMLLICPVLLVLRVPRRLPRLLRLFTAEEDAATGVWGQGGAQAHVEAPDSRAPAPIALRTKSCIGFTGELSLAPYMPVLVCEQVRPGLPPCSCRCEASKHHTRPSILK